MIIVTDGEERQFSILFLEGSSSESRDQLVLILAYVLIFIYQYPSESREKAVSLIVRFLLFKTLTVQQCYRLPQYLPEFHVVEQPSFSLLKTDSDNSHRKSVTSENGHATRIVTNQIPKASSNLNGCVAVVRQGKDPSGILPPYPNEVGDSMHQYACLTRSGTRKYKHVYLFTVICDYPLLDRILQALYNCLPRFRRGLPCCFLFSIRQPTLKETFLIEAEVIHGQSQRFGHVLKPALGEFSHHVDLTYLSFVVKIERFKVYLRKTSSVFCQFDGHGGTEYREALVKANDLLLMQPEEGAVQ